MAKGDPTHHGAHRSANKNTRAEREGAREKEKCAPNAESVESEKATRIAARSLSRGRVSAPE